MDKRRMAILCGPWAGKILTPCGQGYTEKKSLEESYLTETDKPVANPLVVLREEFDDWAILFDPDTGHAFGLNPISVFVWQRLDGRHTIQEILSEMKDTYRDVPLEAENHLREFIDNLLEHGLAGYEYQT